MRRSGPEITFEEFRLLADLIQERCGFVVPPERMSMLQSKLRTRLESTGCHSYTDYYYLLKYEDDNEIQQAVDAITNNETYFFREQAQLDVIVRLALEVGKGRSLRILSMGCSTGEEPYSLAMLLDQAGVFSRGADVFVTGADINSRVLATARSGVFGPHSFRGCEGGYLDWYFREAESGLGLHPELARRVQFVQANMLDADSMASLGKFDIVLCRNVTIYFSTEDKALAAKHLSNALTERGLLFIGHSESLFSVPTDLALEQIDGVVCYRKPGVRVAGGQGLVAS